MSRTESISFPAGMRVRHEARPSDAAAVRRLVEATGFFHAGEVDVAVELVEERLAKGPASGYHFVFVDDGERLAGYACYGPIAATAGSYDLYWIAVDPSAQGKGLGKALLAESERLVRAAGGTRVYIETSNRGHYAPTRGFYVRCGYRQEAVLADFYAPGDDKVIYVRVMPPGREESRIANSRKPRG
jgi:D-alanine-D-alanine ligase